MGPFEWVPTQIGHECMFMVVSATGDASNVSNLTAGDSIPEWRLVPNDNNIGQRNVFPVAAGAGLKGLLADLDGQRIRVKNPLRVPAPAWSSPRGCRGSWRNGAGRRHSTTLAPARSRSSRAKSKASCSA